MFVFFWGCRLQAQSHSRKEMAEMELPSKGPAPTPDRMDSNLLGNDGVITAQVVRQPFGVAAGAAIQNVCVWHRQQQCSNRSVDC